MDLVPKVYEIDYGTIFSNYLNTKLWDASWNVFQYKEFLVTMNLYSISTKSRYLHLEYFISDNQGNRINQDIQISLNNLNLNVVQKQVNGCIFSLISKLEQYQIYDLPEFKEICKKITEEENYLEELIEEWLDDNDIEKESKRESIHDEFIIDNSILDEYSRQYQDRLSYVHLRELYNVYFDITQDDTRRSYIEDKKDITDAHDIYNKCMYKYAEFNTDEHKEKVVNSLDEI